MIPEQDRVMRALAQAARLVDLHGDEFLVFYQTMEQEAANLADSASAADRARRLSRRMQELTGTRNGSQTGHNASGQALRLSR